MWQLDHAAAAAKSLQSCPTLCDPIDDSPPDSPVPGILQARTLEWVAISFSNAWKWKVKVKALSRLRLCVTPWTAAYQTTAGFSTHGIFQARVLEWGAIAFSKLDHKEGWTLKDWCFLIVVLEKTLESPLDCKELNQSILKEINSEYSLEGWLLRLKLQYFGLLIKRLNSLEKSLMEKIEGKRGTTENEMFR